MLDTWLLPLYSSFSKTVRGGGLCLFVTLCRVNQALLVWPSSSPGGLVWVNVVLGSLLNSSVCRCSTLILSCADSDTMSIYNMHLPTREGLVGLS